MSEYNTKSETQCSDTSNAHSAQKASNAAPGSVDAHKNPNVHPIGGQTFGTGANVK